MSAIQNPKRKKLYNRVQSQKALKANYLSNPESTLETKQINHGVCTLIKNCRQFN
jgi:hypothetical protein